MTNSTIKMWDNLLKQGVYADHVLKQAKEHLNNLQMLKASQSNRQAISEVKDFIAGLEEEIYLHEGE